jgi:phosphopantothenate---cysteine ligase (CTP)
MNVLVTAGNTQTPIDRVRCITNIFTGRTGATIAVRAAERGHAVTLLTSHPEAVGFSPSLSGTGDALGSSLQPNPLTPFPAREGGTKPTIRTYRTFDDLQTAMSELIPRGAFDAIIHCAAVSDYHCDGVFAPAEGTSFDRSSLHWRGEAMVDRLAGKVKSDADELWIRMKRAPKLIDQIRMPWGFGGVLVKFKLEVGISDEELLAIAERSRAQSQADLMVANMLEGASSYAFLGPIEGRYQRIARARLADELLDAIESLRDRSDG